ncbi:60S ribosomal protein L31B [Mucor velutinosus]|uniref:60S ribosomal protein L31B n=1 Tax=Mucor velutinosus TaxID=708070 RepID=A0AAN7HVH7_9FUNG|nr:60S ribosomal protein L31B [Mucor velutinosus]
MFDNSETVLQKLTTEVLVHVASFLDLASIVQFSMTGKPYSHLIKDELLFKQLNKRDFRVSEKNPEQTWLDMYKQLNHTDVVMADTSSSNPPATNVSQATAAPTEAAAAATATPTQQPASDTTTQSTINTTDITPATSEFATQQTATDACPHFKALTEFARDVKKILFKSEEAYLCDLCSNNPAAYLSMHYDDHTGACLSCLTQPLKDQQAHYPIQLELVTGDVYCFKCHPGKPRKLDATRDGQIIQDTIDYIRESESMEDLEKRRKTEQALYVQELRREDMSLKHYLVEKQWGRTWMSFRTREGAPLPTKITQSRLSRSNGTLDPNIRLPMDKYRPCPETHGDIVSEKLWRYLAKAYGVQGRAYNEDDIIAPEYARIRVYVDDYKKSIHLYP